MYKTGLLVTTLLLISFSLLIIPAVSNPIPSPTIVLNHEYIWIYMEKMSDGTVYVNVTGKYLMRNIGFKELTMYFPVPNETIRNGKIKVFVNGVQYKYEITYEMKLKDHIEKYWTIYGPLPLVKWDMKDLKSFENYTVVVTYTYRIDPSSHVVGGRAYMFLYALGTGRFYYTYSKRCIADIWFTLKGFKNYGFEMTLADYRKENITNVESLCIEKDEARIYKRLVSSWFSGFRQDLIVWLSEGCMGGEWVPGKPSSIEIKEIKYDIKNKTLTIVLAVVFPNPGYRIVNITKTRCDNTFIADIEILRYTGPVTQVITKKELTINFTNVEPSCIPSSTVIIKIDGEEALKSILANFLIGTSNLPTQTTNTANTYQTMTTPSTSPPITSGEENKTTGTIYTGNYLPLLVSGAIVLLVVAVLAFLRR